MIFVDTSAWYAVRATDDRFQVRHAYVVPYSRE